MQKLALTTLLALSSFGAFLTSAQAHDHDHDRGRSWCYYPCYQNWCDDDDCYPYYEHHRHHHHDHP